MTSETGRIQRAGALAVFLIATAVIILGAWAAFSHYKGDMLDREEEDLLAIAQLKQSLISEHLKERLGDAVVFAARRPVMELLEPAPKGAPQAEAHTQVPGAVELTVRTYGYRRIVILDNNARAVFPASVTNLDRAVLDAIAKSRETHNPVIVELHRTDIGEMAYGAIAPVKGSRDEQRIVGFVYLQSDANAKLFHIALDWPTPSATGESLLVKREGDNVVWISPMRHRRDMAPLDTKLPVANQRILAAKALQGHVGIIDDVVDYRGVEVVGTAAPVEGTSWVLITKMDRAEVEQDLHELMHVIIVLAGLFIVIAAGVSLLIWRTSRLEAAQEQAELAHQYKTAIATTTDAFIRLDGNARLVEVNRALSDMTGYSHGELMKLGLRELEGAETPEETEQHLAAIRKAGSARFETQWRRKNGTLVDLDVSTVYVRTPAGEFYYAYMRDITESLAVTRRLKRLNHFYAFLTRATETINNLRCPEEILQAVCTTAVDVGAFKLAWAGIVDESAGKLKIVAAAGEAADYARSLDISLDPKVPSSRGSAGYAIREKRTVEINDFLNDPRTALWADDVRHYGLRASAAAPIIVGGRVVAAITVCSGELGYFDDEIMALLEEVAHHVALGWEAGEAGRERDAERSMRQESEARFRRIFDASPLPKQIHDRATGDLVSVNKAHEDFFGYPLHEIRGNRWGDLSYPDQALRARVFEQWRKDIEYCAATGHVKASPELELRCRDGSMRTVQGYMTVIGDDVIIAWVNLTEIRRTEAAVAASESRFRGMVEQTITGFVVIREREILYVNPAFAMTAGWPRDELISRDPLSFVDDESRPVAMAAMQRLADGAPSAACTIRFRRKDGTFVTLAMNGAMALWDDRPAIVAMSDDITERERAEERVRESLRRLERSMTGTLNAVARMVDLRDPYTAGHQRRVGIIAADIARELGWSEERCHTMEMIGLVHDIGKIAVPAEILSKPSRLTPLEYDMIKAHAQASHDILRDVEFNIPVAEIIGQHHERLDGSGYPKGLKGDEIHPEARVLAVADVLESMASHRPYRAALGVEAALAELTGKKGQFFDPAIVDVVVHMVKEKGYQLPK